MTNVEKVLLDRVSELIESSHKRVYSKSQLLDVYHKLKTQWGLPKKITASKFLAFLIKEKRFKEVLLKSSYSNPPKRYLWGNCSIFELGLSVQKDTYLSHGTAAFLHGLTDQEPRTIYVNKEQSPKSSSGSLSQEALETAFSRKQRHSKYVLRYGMSSITLLSGKNTGRLGIQRMKGKQGETLEVTDLERTLVDITVRPGYAGGVNQVLGCYISAKRHVSPEKLILTLSQLDYVYPYHQAVGFYMQRAGYDAPSWAELSEKQNLKYDFFLAHGMKKKTYDPAWRIFFPTELANPDLSSSSE
jgi:predicted transcriptional regulator of viral defense system